MNKPLISCITPTFNRAHLLPRAIESTINQTYPHWEMIIVDDGSEDNTEEVVRSYMKKDERIKYFKNPGKGGNAARNYGIKQAKGEWIAFLDDDVENLPERFDLQLRAVQTSGSNFILSGFISIGKSGKEHINNHGLWAMAAGITSRWFIKKELLIKAGLFDETMPAMQENELSYRIAKYEIFVNHFQLVTREYTSEDSVSKGFNGIRGAEMLVKKHKNTMSGLEFAWWNFKIAIGYISIGKYFKAIKYLTIAAQNDTRGIYWIAWAYALFFGWLFITPIKQVNQMVLSKLLGFRFPVIVKHRVIY